MIIPTFLLPAFRTNHAGETGAVYIYKGILSLSKDKDIINFSRNHLKTESHHLELIENILDKNQYSRLILLWKILGFLTGFIPALMGKKFVYATIFSVESFVESHYKEQIDLLKNSKYNDIKMLLNELMADEVHHKDEALEKIEKLNFLHKIWGKLVKFGSISAVKISKLI